MCSFMEIVAPVLLHIQYCCNPTDKPHTDAAGDPSGPKRSAKLSDYSLINPFYATSPHSCSPPQKREDVYNVPPTRHRVDNPIYSFGTSSLEQHGVERPYDVIDYCNEGAVENHVYSVPDERSLWPTGGFEMHNLNEPDGMYEHIESEADDAPKQPVHSYVNLEVLAHVEPEK